MQPLRERCFRSGWKASAAIFPEVIRALARQCHKSKSYEGARLKWWYGILQLVGTGVKLSLGYPLDTDTPGFAEENRTKVCLWTNFQSGDMATVHFSML